MSEEELAELAEVEPAFVRRAVQAGALEAGGPGGFGAQDATRLRFLRAWDAAGLPVEAIADLVRRGQLPLTFLVGPTVDPHPRLASTYQELSAERGIALGTLQRLHDALGFGPPGPSDRARADDLLMVELLEQLIGAGAQEAAVLRLLRVYADAGPACPRPTSASTAARWCSRTATSTAPPSTSPPACPPEPPQARSW
jgi:hypothetical protein